MQTLIKDTGFAVLLSLLPEATMGIFLPLEMLYLGNADVQREM